MNIIIERLLLPLVLFFAQPLVPRFWKLLARVWHRMRAARRQTSPERPGDVLGLRDEVGSVPERHAANAGPVSGCVSAEDRRRYGDYVADCFEELASLQDQGLLLPARW